MIAQKRYILELYFLCLVFLVSLLLFFTGQMYKTHYYGLDKNLTFEIIYWGIMIGIVCLKHFVFQYKILINIVLSFAVLVVSSLFTGIIFLSIMNELERIDNKVTPLGWQFKYKWLTLFLFAFLLVVLLEIIYLIVKREKYLFRKTWALK